MKLGLVSVTYRQLTTRDIVTLSAKAGLSCIEWGGDIHVPSGDLAVARDVAAQTRDAGLTVSCYGSYYRLSESEAEGLAFEKVLESAVALGAPTIRVWAGKRASADADAAYRQAVVADARRIADLAQQAGRTISYEFHGGTLTDTTASAVELLRATEHPAIYSMWQPPNGQSLEICLEGLHAVLDRLSNVHVFHWWPDSKTRLPLEQGAERWKNYLSVLKKAGKNPDLMLEFVPDSDPAILAREAATLKSWVA